MLGIGKSEGPWVFCAILLAGTAAVADDRPAFTPRESRLASGVGEGRAVLAPNQIPVGQLRNYTLEFTVGPSGIALGGGIMVAFPKAWFSNAFSGHERVQFTDPDAVHYMAAEASNPSAALTIEADNLSFSNKSERFRRTVFVHVASAPLNAGDKIRLKFANTRSPIIAGEDSVKVAVDTDGNGEYRLTANPARYTVHAGTPTILRLTAPSQAAVGVPIELRVVALDSFFNSFKNFRVRFNVKGLGEDGLYAEKGPTTGGAFSLFWTPRQEGWFWPVAAREDIPSIRIQGNPIRVTRKLPDLKIFWGDIHSHTRISKDGIGHGEFAYARDISDLDFYSSTEHADDDGSVSGREDGDSITEREWKEILGKVRSFYEPGRFATILGYECSFTTGHYNVYYRGLEGVPWPAHMVENDWALWEKLRVGQAFTVPHHLGISWGASKVPAPPRESQPPGASTGYPGGPRFDWTKPAILPLRPALEVYSYHGQSEFFDPADALAYEMINPKAAHSGNGPHYAVDAWAAGHKMGVLAASDNHTAQPGQGHHGLTAVFARALTREDVFDAMASRRSYGTTGERIVIEFEAGGYSMGEEGRASGPIQGRVLVAAPRPIRFATVRTFEEGGNEWRQSVRWDTPGRLLDVSFRDEVRDKPKTFYLRVELEGLTNNRVARAWSSPIWLSP